MINVSYILWISYADLTRKGLGMINISPGREITRSLLLILDFSEIITNKLVKRGEEKEHRGANKNKNLNLKPLIFSLFQMAVIS